MLFFIFCLSTYSAFRCGQSRKTSRQTNYSIIGLIID